MTCTYKGCLFPSDGICRYHERLEAVSTTGAYSYGYYGSGRTLAESYKKKIRKRGKDAEHVPGRKIV